ncbi:hypothetical protein LTR56_000301 [Elasticomyces elasticus]|nr:hypothetical protein LTR56_000301 [Elasticomyces elasticus]KAK3667004.1 hypothetical protein LTR22_002229 [Elasticomyces elasticus]KAK4933293.1 hypothetical protein LTR49_000287 [Elasticomyces elasticus]KAK5757353.1 hypothetical protein LTS12_012565 [Elasticomyces elasticus]
MAAKAALATVELLESCLSHLEFHDLLAATAVSQELRAVALRSLSLRSTLYLASSDAHIVPIRRTLFYTGPLRPGPELVKAPYTTLPLFPDIVRGSAYPHIDPTTRNLIRLQYSPVGVSTTPTFYDFTWPLNGLREFPKGSFYQDMYICQPPCTVAEIWIRPPPHAPGALVDCNRSVTATLRCLTGIRLGAIKETAEDMLRDHEVRKGFEVVIRFQAEAKYDTLGDWLGMCARKAVLRLT